MPDEDLILEIGGAIDPTLQRALNDLEKRVSLLNKPLQTVKKSLTAFERESIQAKKATLAYTAAMERAHKAATTEGTSAAKVAKATEQATAARDRATAAARRQVAAYNQVAAAERKAASASSLTGRAGRYLNSQADKGMGAAGGYIGAAAGAAGVGMSIKNASGFGYKNQLIANTGELNAADRDTMAKEILKLSDLKRTNQLPEELQKALEVYTSAGLDVKTQGLPALEATGKTAAAYGIPIEDVATTAASAMANLGLKAEEIIPFLDGMSAAGKAGKFEMKNFAEHFGSLSANMAQFGVQGLDGAKYIAGTMQALQVSSKNAAESATNWDNLRNKIFAAETAQQFDEQLGFDLDAFLTEVRKGKGGSESKYGGNVIKAFVEKTKELTGGDIQKVSKIALDAQFRSGLMAAMNNTAITDKANTKWDSSGNVVQKDYEATTKTTQAQMKQAQIEVTKLAIALGDTLAPAMTQFVDKVREVLPPIAQWISEHAELTSNLVVGAGAIIALKLALSPLASLFRLVGGAASVFSSGLAALATGAGPAAANAGASVGGKIMGGMKAALGGAGIVAAAAALGYAMGAAAGEQISDQITKAFNVRNDAGRGLIEGKAWHELSDNVANRKSANAEDRGKAYAFLIQNEKAKEGIQNGLAEIEKTKKELQVQRDALVNKVNATTHRGEKQAAYDELVRMEQAMGQLPAAEARLKGGLPVIETAQKFKEGDPTMLRAALEANQRLEDDKNAKAAGLASVFANNKEKDAAQQLRDIAVNIYGVGEQDPNVLGEKVKAAITEALGERDSEASRSTRQAQSNQESAY